MLDRPLTCILARLMIAGMNTTKPERKQGTQTGDKHRTKPPWNVVLVYVPKYKQT
jgi:hypothetical protein